MDPGAEAFSRREDNVERCEADGLVACFKQPATSVEPLTAVDESTVDWGPAPTADTDGAWEDLVNDWEDDHLDSDDIDEFGHLMDMLGCMQPEL